MATLEKPRQKKTNKSVGHGKTETKRLSTTNEELIIKEQVYDKITETEDQSSTSKQYENHSTDGKIEDTDEKEQQLSVSKQVDSNATEESTKVCEKIQQVVVSPSAPVFEEESEPVQYPDLPRQETSRVVEPQASIESLQAFTKQQLAQLYFNSELEASREFETCFVQSELRPGALAKHPLHELISNYALTKEKLRNNYKELERLRKEVKSCEETAWIIENSRVSGRGQCQDLVMVQASHTFQTCKLQRGVMEEINRLQTQIYRLANDNHLTGTYTAASFRVKVEHYLECAVSGLRNELRACVSVLFRWARTSGPVNEESRDWLGTVVAAILTGADWQDHAYVLCHVLCCPAGVAQWAVPYVQVPLPAAGADAFGDKHVNHAVCVLGMLLRGVAARRDFLASSAGGGPVAASNGQEPWVLVDSDGEEDAEAPFCLRENDLVALLNQVPMGALFVRAMQLDDMGVHLDEHRLLRLFAFCGVIVDLFNDGLNTYGTDGARYHQFCKRLCRLMGHVLRHACDAHELNRATDAEIRARHQIELDALFLRCATYLHAAERLGAWQFLAVLPFQALSTRAAWSFCRLLHTGDERPADIQTPESRRAFEERLSNLSVEASYYLLNTYANMADVMKDAELVRYVTLRLLDTGFVCEYTRESCAKPAAALLSATCARAPQLVSTVVREASYNLERIGPLAAQLFRELPLCLWQPSDEDFALLSRWLLDRVPSSLESCLARLALNELDWTALPRDVHDRVALLVVEYVERRGDDGPWAWQLVNKLRLHASERDGNVAGVPDLSRLETLHRGVRDGATPLCNYLTLLMTQHGHMVPMVCTHGITQLQLLVQAGRFDAAAIVVGHLIPLFCECAPDTLANSLQFQGVLQALTAADRTYVKMARSLVPSEYEPGKNVQLLSSAIEHNMLHAQWRQLLVIWTCILLAQPNWHKDQAVLYLLDTIARISFFDEHAYNFVSGAFKNTLEKRCEEQENNGSSSLLSWVAGNNAWPPLLLPQLGSGSAQYAWLAYVCLDAEHEILEKKTRLWTELLRQLRQQSGKTNVDSCLRRACASCKLPTYTSAGLCVYRWAQLAADTELDHPLLPCLWQNFYHMYLERIRECHDNQRPGFCVGAKFFDGVVNTTFCKKLKRRLQETAQSCADEKRSKVYRAYSLWLDEPLIQDGSLYLPSLPAQYEPAYLALALQQRVGERPWRELCDAGAVRKARQATMDNWNKALGRDTSAQAQAIPSTNNVLSEPPLARIRRRLSEHDKPLPPPQVSRNKYPVPELRVSDKRSLESDLRRHVKQLAQHAELFALQRSEHQALDTQFKELLPHLYKMCRTSTSVGKSCGATCARRATIHLTYTEARANEAVRHQLQTNRSNIQALLSRSAQPVPEAVVASCASIERAATELAVEEPSFKPLAADLFFLLVDYYCDELESYPPARILFRACCATLGDSASAPSHCARLCRTILAQSNVVARLAIDYFHPPHDMPIQDFLQMYSDLIDRLSVVELAGQLLARLDVSAWLRGAGKRPPKLAERSKLIALIFKGLSCSVGSTHELIRAHLVDVFTHEFPEHYGEILQLALTCCADNGLSGIVWQDLITALVRPAELHLSKDEGPLISDQQLRQAVAQQRMLRQDVLNDTCSLLGRYFSEERRKHGATYGLYPRYESCVAELASLCSLVSHALVWTVVCGTGAPADRLVECTYAKLVEMYGPWLLPGWPAGPQPNLTQPWLRDDTDRAQLMLASLASCVTFMLDAMPASRGALSQTWQLYCASYARAGLHDHVLRDVHAALTRLPWKRFWPSVQDLETMTRIICVTQLPLCHKFTRRVFLAVDWTSWLMKLCEGHIPEQVSRVLSCLLQLLVRLPAEVESDDTQQARQLLEQSRKWYWRMLLPADLAHAMDSCVTSIDPRAVLTEELPQNELVVDKAVLRLLASASCYGDLPPECAIGQAKQVITMKRQCYARACVKLIASCAGKHKQTIVRQPQLITRTFVYHLDLAEQLCEAGDAVEAACDPVMIELLQLVNCVVLGDIVTSCLATWLASRSPASAVIPCLWRTCLSAVSNGEHAGKVLEQALSTYFADDLHAPNWEQVCTEVRTGAPRQPPLEQQLANAGRLLALHVLTLLRMRSNDTDNVALLDHLVDLSSELKVCECGIESKLPLLWRDVLAVAQRCLLPVATDKTRLAVSLRRWSAQLAALSESKNGALRAVFGALTGANKQAQLAPQGKLLCRAIAAYVHAQLPSNGDVRTVAGAPCHVGSAGGNTDCAKLLLKMDAGLPDELRQIAEFALAQIQNPNNSMHSAVDFLYGMIEKVYSKLYLNRHV